MKMTVPQKTRNDEDSRPAVKSRAEPGRCDAVPAAGVPRSSQPVSEGFQAR